MYLNVDAVTKFRTIHTEDDLLADETFVSLQIFVCTYIYEAKDEKTGTTLIAMQPLVADQAYMPQMKAMCVPFHMVYGRLMCY